MLDDVSRAICRREMRIIDIDACNLTSVTRPEASSWVVCLKNKSSYTQVERPEDFFRLPAFVGDTKQCKNTTFLCSRKCL